MGGYGTIDIPRLCYNIHFAEGSRGLDGQSTGSRRIKRVVKLLIMINSAPDLDRHQVIANGASDLMVDVFGENGKHARSTVGMAALPLGLAVEAEGVFQITS